MGVGVRLRLLLLVGALTTSMAGCATTPQLAEGQPVQTPIRGDSLHQILERHGTLQTAYTFWLDGHTHSLRYVPVSDETWWLVFQDGWLECWWAEAQFPPLSPEIRSLAWLDQVHCALFPLTPSTTATATR